MHVRCPHCHNPVEIVDDSTLDALLCPSCGSSFGLVGTAETISQRTATGKRIGHFELLQQLGMGAFGSVWKARDTKLDRFVAIKIPRQGQLQELETEKFLRDARAAAQIRHPNIVGVHEVGHENGTLFLVSDFVDGVTLADWLTGHRPSPREAAQLIAQVAEALHHAHEAGVVHRDLKPSNLMLDTASRPHIIDFGLAKRDAGEITMTQDGHILGTPAYMAPEQARGDSHAADRRSDVYSLGVILFELLTGERPFRGNARMLIHQVLREDAPSPRTLNAATPRDLETICLKCLEKDPVKRYRTSQELSDELRRYLNHEPILARPITRLERAWRWSRREPRIAVLLAAVYLSLLLGTIVSAYFAARAQQNAGEAVQAQGDLKKALNAETAAKNELTAALRESQRQLSLRFVERGVAELEGGQRMVGMLSLLKAYQLVDAKMPENVSIRNLMAGWGQGLGEPRWAAGAFAFSPDGQIVATFAGPESVVRLWDVKTGKLLGEPIHMQGSVNAVEFSPDGKMLLTLTEGIDVELWDTKSGKLCGKPIMHLDDGVGYPIREAAFSPDGQAILTCSEDNTARLWDANTGSPRGEPMRHGQIVLAMAFSPDGKTILTGSMDKKARLWDALTGQSRGEPMPHENYVFAVAFSHDGKSIVTGSHPAARIWDTATSQPRGEPLLHESSVRAVAFSPNDQSVLTGSDDQTARLWEASTGRARGTPMRHAAGVRTVAYAPDGQSVVTGSDDKTARLWDANTGTPRGDPLRHDGAVSAVAFSADGESILVESGDSPRQWTALAPPNKSEAWLHDSRVTTAVFSADGESVVTAGDNSARLWDVKTRRLRVAPMEHKHGVQAVAFSPDGKTILTAGWGPTVRLWDTHTGESRSEPVHIEMGGQSTAISPNGETVISGGASGAQMWDIDTGTPRFGLLKHNSFVMSVAFSHDGQTVLTASADKTARLWESKTGALRGNLMVEEYALTTVAFSPDDQMALTGTYRLARLWNLNTAQRHGMPMHHPGNVDLVTFSPDGQLAITVCGKTVRQWDVQIQRMRGTALENEREVTAVAFRPDGRSILCGSVDGTLRLWDLPASIADEPERIRLWIEVATGKHWDANDVVQQLSSEEWLARRDRLRKLGGPPVAWR